jgi:diketogulonate reductase-like aldo/keto reductase
MEETMQYTRVGSSGLRISRIALGTMSFGDGNGERTGWPIGYDDAAEFFRQAVELGITFWDTDERLQLRHLGGGHRPGVEAVHPTR